MMCFAFLLSIIFISTVKCKEEEQEISLGLAPKMPKPPPPDPPRPPPMPHSTTTSLPWTTYSTLSNDVTNIVAENKSSRCNFGIDSTTNFSTSETEPGRLYIDTFSYAQCAGFINWWSVCLWSKSDVGIGSVTLLIIENNNNEIYNITGVNTYDVEIGKHSYNSPICVQFKSEQEIIAKEGSHLGFLLNGSIYMALAMLIPSQANDFNTALRVSRSQIQPSTIANGSGPTAFRIRNTTLDNVGSNNLFPLLKAILGNESLQQSTNSFEHVSETNILLSAEFLSLLGSASAIIAVLSIILLAMSCCLWRLNCCFEMCPCCFQKRRQVTHVVQVEPAFEQSMLYNEMYATSNPVQRRSGQVMPNPAYNLDQSRPLRIGVRDDLSSPNNTLEMTNLPCDRDYKDQLQEAAASYDHPTSRLFKKDTEISDLEHTYETVNIR